MVFNYDISWFIELTNTPLKKIPLKFPIFVTGIIALIILTTITISTKNELNLYYWIFAFAAMGIGLRIPMYREVT